MARKPKSAPSNEPELSVNEVQPSPDDTSAPVRRGRKKASAAGPPPADEAAGMAAQPMPMTETPARGRKLPGRRKAAPPSLLDQALEQQPEPGMDPSGTAAEPASTGDDTMIAEMAYPVSTDDTSAAPATDAAPQPLSHDAPAAKPAAQWDRATGAVRFDWPAIESTASQDGPNQVMAKLLVAARAEGANSRWPL
ncbi:MAG TPA: hypothetical protein VGC15_11320 [Acetobacteraceae bacterium]